MLQVHRRAGVEGLGALLDQRAVERPVQAVVLLADAEQVVVLAGLDDVQDGAQVEPGGLPVVDRRRRRRAAPRGRRPPATVRKPSSASSSRTSSAMNSMKFSTNSGLAGEAGAQLGVLGGDADRAGVEVADPHHDAARDHQRRGGEAELLGAQQRGDDHVAAGLQLAVDLHHDAVAQAVEQQRLLGLGQAELPGGPGVLERRQRAGARCRRRGRRSAPRRTWPWPRPAATVPTPTSATSFTWIRAAGLEFFRSWMSWARSSME